jgi:Zn-dependent protease with chaperone function
MKIKIPIILFLQLTFCSVYGQYEITFREPLKIVAKEKVNSEIKKGAVLLATTLLYDYNDGFPTIKISAKNLDGGTVSFEQKKLSLFEFIDIDNIDKVWDKNQLISGTYTNLLIKGLQYDLRNELHNDAIEYINTLSVYDRFFNDGYFEDYLYTLINKIHSGVLRDKRPGNIYIKIIKHPEPNAFALPNGCIIISTGLLSTIESEDELVGILAHEVAHFALDHQVLNYNREIDKKKRAEFWATFVTVVAASTDAYLTVNNKNHIPGVLTLSTAIAASIFADEIINKLGLKYNQAQEIEADKAAKEILEVLRYNKLGLSAALQRIKNYCIITGNYLALSGTGSHPSLDSRIELLGEVNDFEIFEQPTFLKKVSLINSYNAWIELWYFAHHLAANYLVNKNIKNGVATESDYVVKAVVKRRLLNTKESNEEVINLLSKAKKLNVTPYILIHKEEGITYLRLDNKAEAKKSFSTYLILLNELKDSNEIKEFKNSNKSLEEEIAWTKKMIFKVDNL